MKPQFADTSFFVSYLNARDPKHSLAVDYMARSSTPIVTTMWVLAELGNYLAGTSARRLFVPLVKNLRSEPRITIIAADNTLFDRGLELYARRPDKEWSLTDCISFLVMKARKITDALTEDHHFEQAGFRALLK
jgi:predicted nucleic acid-binding protein